MTKYSELNDSMHAFSEFILLLTSTWLSFLFVTLIPKYFKFATFLMQCLWSVYFRCSKVFHDISNPSSTSNRSLYVCFRFSTIFCNNSNSSNTSNKSVHKIQDLQKLESNCSEPKSRLGTLTKSMEHLSFENNQVHICDCELLYHILTKWEITLNPSHTEHFKHFLTSMHSWGEGSAFGPNFRIGWDTLCFQNFLIWTSNGSFSNWNEIVSITEQIIHTFVPVGMSETGIRHITGIKNVMLLSVKSM